MTIESEITRINTNIANAYTACNNKGATMPASQVSDNLANCVSSIPTGTSPTSPYTITQEDDDYSLLEGADEIFTSITVSGTYADQEEAMIYLGSTLFTITENNGV